MEELSAKPRTKKRSTNEDGQKPVHVISVGSLVASVYLRQAPSGYAYYAYHIKRSYRSLTTGSQIHSTDFFAENRSDLLAVITQASLWIVNESGQARDALQNAA
jgi:hypothetical protein